MRPERRGRRSVSPHPGTLRCGRDPGGVAHARAATGAHPGVRAGDRRWPDRRPGHRPGAARRRGATRRGGVGRARAGRHRAPHGDGAAGVRRRRTGSSRTTPADAGTRWPPSPRTRWGPASWRRPARAPAVVAFVVPRDRTVAIGHPDRRGGHGPRGVQPAAAHELTVDRSTGRGIRRRAPRPPVTAASRAPSAPAEARAERGVVRPCQPRKRVGRMRTGWR